MSDPKATVEGNLTGLPNTDSQRAYARFLNPSADDLDADDVAVALALYGFDPEDALDQERWRYYAGARDLALAYRATFRNTRIEGERIVEDGPNLHVEIDAYLYELHDFDVEPSKPVRVFDLSFLTDIPDDDNPARRDAFRAIIDEMRTNDQPDAVITVSQEPEPSEPVIEIDLGPLFAPHADFASSGTVSFDELRSGDRVIPTFEYPVHDVDWTAFDIDFTRADEHATIQVSCANTTVYDGEE